MRAIKLTNALVLFALLGATVANGGHDGLFVEQESRVATTLTSQPSSQPPETPAPTSGASASATAVESTAAASGSSQASASASESTSSSHSESPSKSTSASTTSHVPAATTSGLASYPTGVNGTSTKSEDTLPLHPQITPALSIAGVILIGTGLVYTLIGIKNKWLHVFLSTAYLTGLSVTVLIVYVMNPPIRNSIQGAYLVAIFFTGVVFGGCSLIFQDLTEGFGCLLGGFCISMWLLCLKPGGLLTSTSSKAIFIAVFTVASYALSFSRHTRPYGLIGSISFAGATAIILGIDCFSRAGLKEFWLYVWSLNDNIFPLNTNTYPITRGIRVEIAGIIIIFLIGIISQVKLWKVIKDRREKNTALRLEDERHRDQMDEAVGRRLEEGNHRERVRWEAVYGDGDQHRQNIDSGIGTEDAENSRKGSMSVVETREIPASTDGIEMRTLGVSREGTVDKRSSNAEGNAQASAPAEGNRTGATPRASHEGIKPLAQQTVKRVSASSAISSNVVSSKPGSKRVSIAEEPQGIKAKRADARVETVSPGPVVIPLPFTVPPEEGSERDADKSSIATFADSDAGPVRQDKRQSDRSILKRFSGPSGKGVSQSEEALIIPYADRSRASSVAATLDDEMSSRRSSLNAVQPQFEDVPEGLLKSPVVADEDWKEEVVGSKTLSIVKVEERSEPDVPSKNETVKNELPSAVGDADISDFPKPPQSKPPTELQVASLTPSTDPPRLNAEDLNDSPEGEIETPMGASAPQSSHAKSEKLRPGGPSETSGHESLKAQAVEQLPSHLSKVVMSYRTNEWAKHLSGADAPGFESLDAVQTDEPATTLAKPAIPVTVEELKQTALNALPSPTIEKSAQPVVAPPQQPPLSRSTSNMSKVSFQEQKPVIDQKLPSRTPSQISNSNGRSTPNLHHSSSQGQIPTLLTSRGLRSSSTPFLGQTLVTSPIEENVETVYPPRNVVSPIDSTTLMAQRDSRVRNRYSSTPLNVGPSDSTPQLSMDPSMYITPNHSSPQFQSPISMDDDNVSLSQRRELLQRPPSSQELSSLPPQTTRLSSHASSFDSHQPQRQTSSHDPQKREAMLATWRESMRRDVAATVVPKATVEQRRADMMLERHHSRQSKQFHEAEKVYKDQAMDQAMRSRDMMEAHKEAMRRMQASANKHI